MRKSNLSKMQKLLRTERSNADWSTRTKQFKGKPKLTTMKKGTKLFQPGKYGGRLTVPKGSAPRPQKRRSGYGLKQKFGKR